MDTRGKILTPAEAIETAERLRGQGKTLNLVTGCFDPLLSEHARRLDTIRNGAAALMVVIAEPERPLMTARARAELVAGLAAVDFVVVPGREGPETLLKQLPAAEVAREETVHAELRRELIQHVQARQRAV